MRKITHSNFHQKHGKFGNQVSENGMALLPKWMNIAYDIYNTVFNHSKSVIFHKPVDTEALDCPDYYKVIRNPIDLETMKVN
jgi:hypothetical protein